MFRSGQILAMRLIDMADAIDLKRAEILWSQRRQRQGARARLSAPPKAMAFGVPPLELALDPPATAFTLTATVRLYDFGVAAFTLAIPFQTLEPAALVALANQVDAELGQEDASVWPALLAQVQGAVAEALLRPARRTLQEEYLIAMVRAVEGTPTAAALMDRFDIGPILSGETRPLSDGARTDLLRNRFSYYEDDLVVLGWDRAFIYEPRGDTDVIDALEVANAQLLEMRYYDELLDDELPRIYDLVEEARRAPGFFAARRYARIARRLLGQVAEVTELTERVDNALQVTEDVYLARVYAAAMDLFRVPNVSAAVDRKLSIIRDTYSALYSEASAGRAEVLEIAVVVLIVLEVVVTLLHH